MRIITWNLAQQGDETWRFLLNNLNPDVALVQEAILPEYVTEEYETLWTPAFPDARWGSGILIRKGTRLVPEWHDWSRGAVIMGRCSLPGIGPMSIVSVHARVNRITRRVIPDLRETFTEVRTRLAERFILGGDLNTAREAGRRWPEYGHIEFWRDIEASTLKDCHYLKHGVERQSFWRGALRYRPASSAGLQDDHVFVDEETHRSVGDCYVYDTQEVRGLSDHGPVVVELTLRDTESASIKTTELEPPSG